MTIENTQTPPSAGTEKLGLPSGFEDNGNDESIKKKSKLIDDIRTGAKMLFGMGAPDAARNLCASEKAARHKSSLGYLSAGMVFTVTNFCIVAAAQIYDAFRNIEMALLSALIISGVFSIPVAFIYFMQSRIASAVLMAYCLTGLALNMGIAFSAFGHVDPASVLFQVIVGALSLASLIQSWRYHAALKEQSL